jgi:ABC-type bacteriocin/lantibiotic exporter with double-glycine peptidase domain
VLSNQTVTAILDGSFVIVYGLLLLLIAPVFGLIALVLCAGQILLLVMTARRMTALVVQELTAQGPRRPSWWSPSPAWRRSSRRALSRVP